MKRYRTIVADPPWAYSEGWPTDSTSTKSAFRREGVKVDTRRRSPLPYPSMGIDEIKSLPVEAMAATDAHLFLWTTNRYLRGAYTVAEAWGFRPSQLLTWCKSRRGIGPGGVFASTSEFVIYARRGKPPATRTDSTWFDWPRAEHSRKPEAFLDMVESITPGPYLEMFARRNRLGWDTWGNESHEHVDLSSASGSD